MKLKQLPINSYYEIYKDYLKSNDKSSSTINNYLFSLSIFGDLLGSHSPEKLTQNDLNKFIDIISHKTKGDVRKTKLRHLKQLRYFIEFLEINNVDTGISSTDVYKIDRKLQEELHEQQRIYKGRYIEKKELLRLNQYWKRDSLEETLMSLRNRVIISLLADTGMKVSELRDLKKVNYGNQNKITVTTRTLIISKTSSSLLNKYLGMRPDYADDLLVSYSAFDEDKITAHPLTVKSIQRIVKKTAQEVGIGDEITPQVLRNSRMVDALLDNSLDYDSLTYYFGLSQTNSSYQRYLSKAKELLGIDENYISLTNASLSYGVNREKLKRMLYDNNVKVIEFRKGIYIKKMDLRKLSL